MALSVANDHELKVRHANVAVDAIASALKKNKSAKDYPLLSGKRVTEVLKGGSLGHGTTVPGEFDVDLVLLSEDITPEEMLDTHGSATSLVDDLKRYIQREFGRLVKTVVAPGLLLLQFSVEVKKEGVEIEVEVDLLLAPYWRDIYQAADCISKVRTRHAKNWEIYRTLFSPAFSKWQSEYIREQPNRVKELIKRVKKWKKQKWPPGGKNDGRPTSYIIEILVVVACKRWCKNHRTVDKLDDHMSPTEFMNFVTGVQSILIGIVTKHQTLELLESPWFNISPGGKYTGDIRAGHPYILDPADPFNNLYETAVKPYDSGYPGQVDNWGAFARNIGSLDLTRDLFQ